MSVDSAKKIGLLIPHWYDSAADLYRPSSATYPAPVNPIAKRLSYYFAVGTTAGYQIKTGSGRLAGLVLSQISVNAVVTLYDNTTSAGTILWASGALPATTLPVSLDFFGLPFSTGLRLVVSGANASVVATYE